jgi:hypothetical protein
VARGVERAVTHVPQDRARLYESEKERGDGLRVDVGPSEIHLLREDHARECAVVPDKREVPQAAANVPEDGLDHFVLALEVPVQRGRDEADPPRQAGDAQSSQAMASEEGQRRLDDLLAASTH